MNLIDEAEIKKSNSDQGKMQKKLILLFVFVAILIVLAVVLMLQINVMKNKKFKFYFDGTQKADNDIFRKADDGSLYTGKDLNSILMEKAQQFQKIFLELQMMELLLQEKMLMET